MTAGREAFLERVREAVRAGNRAGEAIPLGPRGPVGYQGGGADLAATFGEALAAAGGRMHRAADRDAARRYSHAIHVFFAS